MEINRNVSGVYIHTASRNSFYRKSVFILLSKLLGKKIVVHIHHLLLHFSVGHEGIEPGGVPSIAKIGRWNGRPYGRIRRISRSYFPTRKSQYCPSVTSRKWKTRIASEGLNPEFSILVGIRRKKVSTTWWTLSRFLRGEAKTSNWKCMAPKRSIGFVASWTIKDWVSG